MPSAVTAAAMAGDAEPLPPMPSALVHLLGVELLPVYGFGLASWSAGTHFLAHELMATRFVGRIGILNPEEEPRGGSGQAKLPPTLLQHVDCIGKSIWDYMWTRDPLSAYQCPGCDETMECPKTFAPGAIPIIVHGALVLTYILIAWVLGQFAWRGLCCRRAGSGAYLWFTWELETRLAYRVIVKVMILATLLTMALILFVIVADGGDQIHHSLLSMVTMDALALTICLRRLLVSRTGMHHWVDSQQLRRCHFHRTWFKLPRTLPESNDAFASKLLDALWQAKHGNKKYLRQLVLDPRDADMYVSIFSNMPPAVQEESEEEEDGDSLTSGGK